MSFQLKQEMTIQSSVLGIILQNWWVLGKFWSLVRLRVIGLVRAECMYCSWALQAEGSGLFSPLLLLFDPVTFLREVVGKGL